MIERAAAAHGAGLAFMAVGDHHNMQTPYVQNVPIMGRLLAEWPDRPAGPLFLLPLWHPLIAAEHIGTLAAIHTGPLIVQTGLGRDQEQFGAVGQLESHRGRRMDAVLPAIQSLLNGDVVDAPELNMRNARVGLLPPEPVQWWIGGSVGAAFRRAAEWGDGWYANSNVTPEQAAAQNGEYRSRCDSAGRPARSILRRDVLVFEDGERAQARGREILAGGYRGLAADQVMFGGVEQVRNQIQRFADMGFDDIAVRCMSPDQNEALESIALLGMIAEDSA